MSARKGRPDAAQQKAKRQKILVGAGALILLVLMVVEVPKILNHGKTPSAATSTDTGSTSTTPESTPTTTDPTAQPVSATPVAPTNLPNAGGASAADGQLVSFSLFQSKDPFRQQLTASGVAPGSPAPPTSTTPTSPQPTPPAPPSSGSPPSPTPTPAPPTTPTTPTPTTPAPTTPTPTTPTPTTPTPTPPTPSAPASASISVNGVAETVAVGASFPLAQPLFRLVSLKAGVARIGVAGGTLQGSSQTVELVKGKPLTLMNTADGMRYVLRLVSVA